MVELQPSKLIARVRFPPPAPYVGCCGDKLERKRHLSYRFRCESLSFDDFCPHSSGVEHFLGKEEVPGSNPGVGSSNMIGFYRFIE